MVNELSKYAEDAQLADKVRALCNHDIKYESIIRNVISADFAFENDSFGFQFKDIPDWSGAHVNVLMQKGIVKYGYKSNSATHYRLAVDREMLSQVMQELEKERIETEQKGRVCQMVLEPSMISEFEELVASGQDMVSYWAQRLNPRIIGMEREREACLISLASPPDKDGLMRRCHTLIWGPPGTAKSLIIAYIKHNLDAVGIAPKSTEAGLKLDGRDATPGAMMLAHHGTLVIEEIDKFDRKTLESLYEAMTTGEFDVNVGNIRQTCPAELRAIAVGNDIKKLPAPLIDRFDMTFYYEIPSKDAEKKITDDLYLQWITSKEDYRGEKLRAFLAYIKPFEPELTAKMLELCMKLKNAYIDLSEKKPDIREKEAFMRVAYVIAKINHREVRVEDYLRAVRLVDEKFTGAKYNALEILARELSK